MGCTKAQGSLAKLQALVTETVDARKQRLDAETALALARGMDRVIGVKGMNVVTINLKNEPNDDDLLAVLMGPTGNLRAPTIRIGKTLVVGFNPQIYKDVLS